MTQPAPNWAALYQKHRDGMHKVAAKVLREAGMADQAEDAVQSAMTTLMASPPAGPVGNWEAFLVTAAKNKAYDILRSAHTRHSGPELNDEHDHEDERDEIGDLDDKLDRQRRQAMAWDALAILDERHRKVAWEYLAKERPRGEIAGELGVTPARVSQMAVEATKKLREAIARKEAKE